MQSEDSRELEPGSEMQGYVERLWDLDGDILWSALVACVPHASRELCVCVRACTRTKGLYRESSWH